MSKSAPKTTVGVRLESEWILRLDTIAKESGISRSDAARRIIEAGLNSVGEDEIKSEAAKMDSIVQSLQDLKSERSVLLDEFKSAMSKSSNASQESDRIIKELKEIVLDQMKLFENRIVNTVKHSPKTEKKPDSPSLIAARNLEPPSKQPNGQKERRGPDRPQVNQWATLRDSDRSMAHYITAISPGGYIYFACGKDDSALRYRFGGTASRLCPKCEAKLR